MEDRLNLAQIPRVKNISKKDFVEQYVKTQKPVVIEHLIEQHKNNEELQTAQHNGLAISLALSLAINEQKKLSNEEMLALKTELLKCNIPSVCPLGKATLINLQTADLEKYF